MIPTGAEPLETLVGRPLTSVVFVADYMQLVFDDYVLSLLFWPLVRTEHEVFELDWLGYEKTIRNLIGLSVTAIDEAQESVGCSLVIGGSSIVMAPSDVDLHGPEILKLFDVGAQRLVHVWRHGDPPFQGAHS